VSDEDPVLGLLDDLLRLAGSSSARTIEVEADDFAVSVTRRTGDVPAERTAAAPAEASTDHAERTQRVHATTVGIFSGAREWKAGDEVARGAVLGAIQSLGHMAEITAPADGSISEVLVAPGAPVEYGQPLFAIVLR